MKNNFPCFIPTMITIIAICLSATVGMLLGVIEPYMSSDTCEEVESETTDDHKRETENFVVVDTTIKEISSCVTEIETSEETMPEFDSVITVETTVAEPVEKFVYYDVPLNEELQAHIFKLCDERGIDPRIIIGMIETESRYTSSAVGDSGNSLGLMQIQPRFHYGRMEEFGCYNLLNPFENVTVGIDIFADLYESSGSIEWSLMAYNGGPAYANRLFESGTLSNYVYSVLAVSEGLRTY